MNLIFKVNETKNFWYGNLKFELKNKKAGIIATVIREEEYKYVGYPKKTVSEAIISVAKVAMEEIRFISEMGDAVEIITMAYAAGLLDEFEVIPECDRIFMFRGTVYRVVPTFNFYGDEYEIHRINSLDKVPYGAFHQMNSVGKTALGLMIADAKEENRKWNKSYDEWESSWIDGPQW